MKWTTYSHSFQLNGVGRIMYLILDIVIINDYYIGLWGWQIKKNNIAPEMRKAGYCVTVYYTILLENICVREYNLEYILSI